MKAPEPLISDGLKHWLGLGQVRDLPDDLLSDCLSQVTLLLNWNQEGSRTANDALPEIAVQALQS